MTPKFFKTPEAFRKWLEKNHKTENELVVGFYKKESGKLNMTWSQSVDEALCFGWIDGIRRSIDKDSYSIRFTPRSPKSTWSAVNQKKMDELMKKGLIHDAGLKIYNQRRVDKTEVASYESEPKQLDKNMENRFKENKSAWEFFTKQPPSYKKTIVHWILAAKQNTTRINRLEKTIEESEKQKRLFR